MLNQKLQTSLLKYVKTLAVASYWIVSAIKRKNDPSMLVLFRIYSATSGKICIFYRMVGGIQKQYVSCQMCYGLSNYSN